MSSVDLKQQLAVEHVKSNEFVSKCLPQGMGNKAPIAYGGITSGIAVSAALGTVKEHLFLYSMLGSFHGPARNDRKTYCRVHETRNTKTFATRRVVAYQIQDDKSERVCADLLLDFHVREQGLFEYDAPPSPQYFSHPEDPLKTAPTSDIASRLLEQGATSQIAVDAWTKSFSMSHTFFDTRLCIESVSGQNLHGLVKNLETSQDHLPIHQKVCAEWFRTREPIQEYAEHMSALAFMMDGALSFLPLTLDHKDLFDAGACSTLDFALRVLMPDMKMDAWHMRERRTIAAHGARTYSESRLWNQAGQMVAVMTQTCIMRSPAKQQDIISKL